jgi:hypothetical protein
VLHVAIWCVLRIATAGLGDSYGERPQPSILSSFGLYAPSLFNFVVQALNRLPSYISNICTFRGTINSRLRCSHALRNYPLG